MSGRNDAFALASHVRSFRSAVACVSSPLSRTAGSESRKSQRNPPPGAISTPFGSSPEGHRSSTHRLRAVHRPSRRLRRRPVETMTKLHVSRKIPSEGPPLAPHATPHGEVDKGSPPRWFFEHPMGRWLGGFRRVGVPFDLLSQPRPSFQRRPAKGNAFPKAGMLSVAKDPARDDETHHVVRPQSPPRHAVSRLHGVDIASERYAPFFSPSVRLTLTG